jgi:DNA-binding transcriptional ArsR family regulator
MPRLPQPDAATFDLSAVLHALGDPVRLGLVRALAVVGELTCAPPGMDVPKSTLSNHWRILREAGLTVTVRDGRHRRMSLRRDDLEGRFPGLLAVVLESASSMQAPRSLPRSVCVPVPRTAVVFLRRTGRGSTRECFAED